MNQAELFENYMRAVWDDNICDQDGNTMYDTQHNANTIAQVLMAKPTGGGDSEWKEWLFPDGSIAWIMISGSGTSKVLP
jgi:hypothetical protein